MTDDHTHNDNTQIQEILYNVKYKVGFQYCDDRLEKGDMNILYFNIRGLKSKINELLNFISLFSYEVDIVVLVESWVQANEVCLINFPDYNVFNSCRLGRGGGICVLVRKNILCSLVFEKDLNKNNYLVLKLIQQNLNLVCVYKCPSSDTGGFLDVFDGIVEQYQRAIIVGDFNLNLFNSTNPSVSKFLDIISANGFNIVNKIEFKYATRISSTTSTLIDYVLTDRIGFINSVYLEDVTFSDHRGIQIKTSLLVNKATQINKFKIFNYELAAKSQFWNQSDKYTNIDDYVAGLEKLVISYTEEKTLNSRSGFKQPWMTNELYSDIRTREKIYKLTRKYPHCSYLNNKLKIAKAAVHFKLNKAKREYYHNKLSASIGKPQEFWNLIKMAISNKRNSKARNEIALNIDGIVVNEPVTVANAMNFYFIHACDSLWPQIDININQIAINTKLNLHNVTEEEVSQNIRTLKTATATGQDGISSKFLQFFQEKLKRALTCLINKSISEGRFPGRLKVARIIPLYKDGDVLKSTNYRPISILSAVSKVYEKIVNNRLVDFLEKNNVIAQEQYGFRRASNTQAACLALTDYISEKVDKKLIVASLFLDLRKAFDSVDHSVLLAKLQLGLKFEPMQILWFQSYLKSRPQVVAVNQAESDYLYATKGVPQGSILGPVLFNIYINDICNLELKGKVQLYADDAVLKYSSTNLKDLYEYMQTDLNVLKLWLTRNRLQLNVSKTKFMIFTNRMISDTVISEHMISYNGVVVERVKSFKYLGLMLDSKLKWDLHIEMIKSKIRPYIFSIRRMKQILPRNSLIIVYNAFILTHLTYLNPVWGGCAEFRRNELEVLQKRTLKHIYHLPARYPTIDLVREIPQLKLARIIQCELLILIFKILRGLIKFDRPLPQTSDIHSYDTRRRSHFQIEFFKTNLRNSNIIYKGLQEYNALPRDIKRIETCRQFKRCVKIYLKNK